MNTPKARGQRPEPDSSVVSGQLSVANTPDAGPRTTNKAHYIMIGGFLGAGKTTSAVRLAQHLTDQGLKVGLITNDQGSELVDTAMLRSRGFATEEIPGGCFCCRFNSLVDAAHKLTVSTRPDMFIAEPVGSCTDLVATVGYPLRRIYGDNFSIAPLSVLVDPIRALRVFGLESGGQLSEKVLYIYRKQLEEADIIAVNKRDLLDATRQRTLRDKLTLEFPRAEIVEVSARQGAGLDAWFNRVTAAEQIARAAMEVDYALYAEGEALLGWLNCTAQLEDRRPFDANAVLKRLASRIQAHLQREGAELAHLKMTFSSEESLGGIAVINLVRNDYVPEVSLALEEPVHSGELVVNLRAEAEPEVLRDCVRSAVSGLAEHFGGLDARLEHLEHFRPGKPQPTHRLTTPG